MPRNKSEKELAKTSGWVTSDPIILDKWMHASITYDTNTAQTIEFNIPTERGIEIYRVNDDGKLTLKRIIKNATI